jgi:hypothetical protein
MQCVHSVLCAQRSSFRCTSLTTSASYVLQTMWMPEDRAPFSTWEHPTILRRQKRAAQETAAVQTRLLHVDSDMIGQPLAGYPQVGTHTLACNRHVPCPTQRTHAKGLLGGA